jgi:NADP-dependent 3-hydroxy acid dehydrogenase YdfG
MGTSNIEEKVVAITEPAAALTEHGEVSARQGAKVVLGARRKTGSTKPWKRSRPGGKAIGFAVDVTKRSEVEALIKQAVDSFGRVDAIINNAGIMPIAPVEALLKVENGIG